MSTPSQQNHNSALVVLTTLFFMMGFITCMNDILIPHLKDIFTLTNVQAMLVQFCFFTSFMASAGVRLSNVTPSIRRNPLCSSLLN